MGRKKKPVVAGDWRLIEDDREKYAAYLCSREWAERREAVRRRAVGVCERCRILPMDHVHHLTYARKYKEPLEDLQASCKSCHEFTHGKSDFDPCSLDVAVRRYLRTCKELSMRPMPYDMLVSNMPVSPHVKNMLAIADRLQATCAELGIEPGFGILPPFEPYRTIWLAISATAGFAVVPEPTRSYYRHLIRDEAYMEICCRLNLEWGILVGDLAEGN